MTAARAIVRGFGSALGAPGMVLSLWLVNVVVALPAVAVLTVSIGTSIGPSLMHETMRDGFDVGWFGEYSAAAKGLETAFTPTIVGAGAFWANLESWVSGGLAREFPGIVGLGVLYALLWALLLGGVLSRFAGRPEARGAGGFLASGGRFFFRFLRLAVLSAPPYLFVLAGQRWAFERLGEWTRDLTNEWTVLLLGMAAYGAVAVLLCFVHMVFSYAKIAMVVDDRRSAVLAALRAFTFVLRHPGRTFTVYYGVLFLGVAPLVVYAALAPGARGGTVEDVALAFAAGQAILIVRLVFRLALLGGQTALYQGGKSWPDTPGTAAESGS